MEQRCDKFSESVLKRLLEIAEWNTVHSEVKCDQSMDDEWDDWCERLVMDD